MSTVINFIIVLGILVFVHELGHFLVAKLVGIRVERFSLGFPPRMFGKKIGDTDYCISWLPIGGYVKMSGMIDESMDDSIKGEPWEFMSKSLPKRFMAIFAGPLFNYLLAILLFGWLTWDEGVRTPVNPVISEVIQGGAAEVAGLKANDEILTMNDEKVVNVDRAIEIFSSNANTPVALKILRDGSPMELTITPAYDEEKHSGRIGVQIGQKYGFAEVSFFSAMWLGLEETLYVTKLLGKALSETFFGKESIRDNIAGPIGIAKMVGEAADAGVNTLLRFMAFLSLQLGLLNLLPIPALDGGHIIFIAIEGIMKRPPKMKTRMVVQQIGMAFLLMLMVFIIFNDITR